MHFIHAREDFSAPLRENLRHALRVSLLLLPETFSERELYEQITRLSYTGDPRMVVGENKNKVQNIVAGNFHGMGHPFFVREHRGLTACPPDPHQASDTSICPFSTRASQGLSMSMRLRVAMQFNRRKHQRPVGTSSRRAPQT